MSYLDDLKARLDKAVTDELIDIDVPRSGGVVLRCRALTEDEVDALATKAAKAKLRDNAKVLAHACVGVYHRTGDDKVEPITGQGTEAPNFASLDMYEALGLRTEVDEPTDVVRTLYAPVPLAMPSAAAKVLEHSGLAVDQVLGDLAGE